MRNAADRYRKRYAFSSGEPDGRDWGINQEQVYLNDSLFMVYESDILNVNALQKYDAYEDFICDPLAPAIKRSTVQVMKTDEGFEMVLYYAAGLYTNARLDAFHAAVSSELEKLGCTVTESEGERRGAASMDDISCQPQRCRSFSATEM